MALEKLINVKINISEIMKSIYMYAYKNIKLHLDLKYYTENFFNKFYILKSQRRNNVYYDIFKHSGAFIIQWGEADSFAA